MEAQCPSCQRLVALDETTHYRMVTCPGCGTSFEALSQETRQVGQEFLDRLLAEEGDAKRKDDGGDGRNRTGE